VNGTGIPSRFLEGSGLNTMQFHVRFRVGVFLLAGLAGLLEGCNKEGEGDRCDPLSGNSGTNDCEPPLVCSAFSVTASQSVYRCCPPPGMTATAAVCNVATNSLDASPAVPGDDGPSATDVQPGDGDDGAADQDADEGSGDDSVSVGADATIADGGGGADATPAAADVGADE